MDAAALKVLYERQLVADLDRPTCGPVERADAGRILTASCHLPSGELRETDHPVVWVWSDLHLGHFDSIAAFVRPFETADEMDDALLGCWRRVVGPDDAIVCLGDVAVHGVSGRSLERLREAPGWKILLVGNHDPGPRGRRRHRRLRRGVRRVVRGRRPAVAVDAHALAKDPEGLRQRPRPPSRRADAGRGAVYQRLGRAGALPAAPVDGDPRARGTACQGRGGPGPYDGAPARAGAVIA